MTRSGSLSLLLPGLTLVIATLAAAMPWGPPVWLKPAMPLLPYAIAHFWIERRERAMPDWLVFLSGLATDVLGQGPLGYWALAFLAGYVVVRQAATQGRPWWIASIIFYAVTVGLLVPLQWLVSSLYYLQPADIMPLLTAAAASIAFYAAVVLLVPIAGFEERRFNGRLERGA